MVNAAATVMIPGRVNCPASYVRQYNGWIMSNHYTHPKPHTFVCVDAAPEAIEGSDPGSNNGALLYPTETEGPPLSGWVHNREVSCVVCAAPTPKVATFVRWGRNACAGISNVKEIYAGWAAGGHYTHPGSGAEYLCMANSPEYLGGFNDNDQNGALLYRAEYRTAEFGVAPLRALNFRDVPCSVCEVPAEKVQMSKFAVICGRESHVLLTLPSCAAFQFLAGARALLGSPFSTRATSCELFPCPRAPRVC